jgi:putative SOS response-associated peptidase YedK
MCGRVVCAIGWQQISSITGAKKSVNQNKYNQSYNIAPTQYLPTVYKANKNSDKNNLNEDKSEITLEAIKWGSINFYGNLLVNLRSENIIFVEQYRNMLKNRNFCLVRYIIIYIYILIRYNRL